MSGLEIVPYSAKLDNAGHSAQSTFGGRTVNSIHLKVSLARFEGFDLSRHLFEYRLLGAHYVQKAKYKALMDERGILSRDELSNIQFRRAQLFNVSKYEELFTLTARGDQYIIYDKKSKYIQIFDARTQALVDRIFFPTSENELISLMQPLGVNMRHAINENFLVVTVSTVEPISLEEEMDGSFKFTGNHLYILDLQKREIEKVTIMEASGLLKAEYSLKNAGESWIYKTFMREFEIPRYPHMVAASNQLIFYSYLTASNVSKQDEIEDLTWVCSYDLLTKKVRVIAEYQDNLTLVELDENMQPSLFVKPEEEGGFKIVKISKEGQFETMLSFGLEECLNLEILAIGLDYITILDKSEVDRGIPTYIPFDRPDERIALMREADIKSLPNKIKLVVFNPKDPKEIIVFTTYYEREREYYKTAEGQFYCSDDETLLRSPEKRVELAQILSHLVNEYGIDLLRENSLPRGNGVEDYYLLSDDAGTGKAELKKVFTTSLADFASKTTVSKISDIKPFTFTARDGLKIQAYLTLPHNITSHKNLPTMLLIHGGPIARDKLKFDADAQFYASRGFAVVQINYRGSKGFGKEFQECAYGDRYGAMIDDLVDGIYHLQKKGIVDMDRLVASGYSYGGLAVTALMTKYPDLFQCGVAINGVYDYEANMQDSIDGNTIHDPDAYIIQLQADPRLEDAEAEREKLRRQSPITYINRLKKPLLLISGADDKNCLPHMSDDFTKKGKRLGKNIMHAQFSQMGHTPNIGNLETVWGLSENFISQHVPGVFAEPIDRDFANNPRGRIKSNKD
jgi:pimeloyl-ACP methyl ester carboxylesterase